MNDKLITVKAAEGAIRAVHNYEIDWMRAWLDNIGPFTAQDDDPCDEPPGILLLAALENEWAGRGLRFPAGAGFWKLGPNEMGQMLDAWKDIFPVPIKEIIRMHLGVGIGDLPREAMARREPPKRPVASRRIRVG